MIDPKAFLDLLEELGIQYFTGVPDSLLKDFTCAVEDRISRARHVIAANEGGAVALAAGWHMATGTIPLVYMQNAGQGNAVNPLLSLADPDVYGIPMLLFVGWRGEPDSTDEPQHMKQGKATPKLFEAVELAYAVLPDTPEEAKKSLENALSRARERSAPYAFLVRKNTFAKYAGRVPKQSVYEVSREEALAEIIKNRSREDCIISTTGMVSRELFELREKNHQGHAQDFLNVGAMGHVSQIALGVALAKPQNNIWCIDGDGSILMHMGALAVIGAQSPKNFKHIVINNGAHDSVGGQATAAFDADLCAIARASGYASASCVESRAELAGALDSLAAALGPAFLEIRVARGARKDLGRPTTSLKDLKRAFMEFLKQ